jgi:predicted membrane protein
MNDNKLAGTRTFVGGILIIIGILMFLSINDFIDLRVGHIVFSWPFFMFIIGIMILLNSRNRTLGVILTAVGAFFLIPRVFPSIYFEGSLIFPLLIIGLGVYIIVKRRQTVSPIPGKFNDPAIRKDYIDDVAVFGGGSKSLISDNFRGGNITAVFGGSEIDLSGCKLAEGENVIDVLMVFGGTDIHIPKEWNVIINVTPLFGGFSNKVIRDPSLPIDTTRTLVIKGMALFGGGEVKNKF